MALLRDMDELSAYVAFCALVEDILPADYYTNLEGRAAAAERAVRRASRYVNVTVPLVDPGLNSVSQREKTHFSRLSVIFLSTSSDILGE